MIREATGIQADDTTANGAPLDEAVGRRPSRSMPRSQRILLRMVALLAGVALAAIVIFVFFRDTTPTVTRPILAEAVARWQQAAPANYDLHVSTSRDDHFEIEVRDGQVTAMKRNGNQYPEDRLTDTWLVESQFEYIQNDLNMADIPENHDAVRLIGVFDADFGFPSRYRCTTSTDRPETGWEVTHFRIVKP